MNSNNSQNQIKRIARIPLTSPPCTINTNGEIFIIGTWNGYIYCKNINETNKQLSLSEKSNNLDPFIIIQPIYSIRHINIRNTEILNILLGSSSTTNFIVKTSEYTPVIPMNINITDSQYFQHLELRSNIQYGQVIGDKLSISSNIDESNDYNNEIPSFIVCSISNSYLGIDKVDKISIKWLNFNIPDREFILLDYDYKNKLVIAIERSPDRLHHSILCSLQVIHIPDNIIQDNSEGIISILNLPPLFLLNFPIKPWCLLSSKLKSEISYNSSNQYKISYILPNYRYHYPTLFKLSNLTSNKSKLLDSRWNINDAKFWGYQSIVLVISNYMIVNFDITICISNSNNIHSFMNTRFVTKSPSRFITSTCTSHPLYLIILTETDNIVLLNRKGEIIKKVDINTPNKHHIRWVWPRHLMLLENGTIFFTSLYYAYSLYCAELDQNNNNDNNRSEDNKNTEIIQDVIGKSLLIKKIGVKLSKLFLKINKNKKV
ncbi:uncharacterized protein CMU_042870 [Cryptosporidium muris RN66]|uniref:Uncharacterized protein n=1 Tax=Cryptosporidium muris (strain RN66) TaxID=441375 RepID=B6AAH2_CRYMR|nr:uncharacterized protein CMU_042870 [Cryptosporidium muris RN66]EEA05213.1 hypothetical protein, conserved [Cryptosporidium muris RN66]|eukprot:XP_002139562.1 hypothetical protein [Cryptosporidium muris RN66]